MYQIRQCLPSLESNRLCLEKIACVCTYSKNARSPVYTPSPNGGNKRKMFQKFWYSLEGIPKFCSTLVHFIIFFSTFDVLILHFYSIPSHIHVPIYGPILLAAPGCTSDSVPLRTFGLHKQSLSQYPDAQWRNVMTVACGRDFSVFAQHTVDIILSFLLHLCSNCFSCWCMLIWCSLASLFSRLCSQSLMLTWLNSVGGYDDLPSTHMLLARKRDAT